MARRHTCKKLKQSKFRSISDTYVIPARETSSYAALSVAAGFGVSLLLLGSVFLFMSFMSSLVIRLLTLFVVVPAWHCQKARAVVKKAHRSAKRSLLLLSKQIDRNLALELGSHLRDQRRLWRQPPYGFSKLRIRLLTLLLLGELLWSALVIILEQLLAPKHSL